MLILRKLPKFFCLEAVKNPQIISPFKPSEYYVFSTLHTKSVLDLYIRDMGNKLSGFTHEILSVLYMYIIRRRKDG